MAQPSGDFGQENLRVRSGDLVAGRYLVSVGGPDGSDLRPCPPEHWPIPRRRATGEQRGASRASSGPGPSPAVGPLAMGSGPGDLPLLDREAEVAQLLGKLAEGRSIRLLGDPGSGRSALLAAVAEGAGGLAPHGVIQLCGHRRDGADLLQDLFTAAYQAPGYRPDESQLPELLATVGAIVVIDEVAQEGAELEELLARAPECAFLLVPAFGAVGALPPGSRLEDHPIGGLPRAACLALTARLAGRALDEAERAWAVDLWFESQGLPLRFVQAAALLRRRDLAVDTLLAAEEDRRAVFGGDEDQEPADEDPAIREAELRGSVPLPSVAQTAAPALLLVEGLGDSAQAVLRLAVAFGGECPTAAHLPALIDVDHGESALRELVECGLAESLGGHHRLTEGVLEALAAHWGPETQSPEGAARHFSWWVGHSAVSTEQIAAEAEVVLGALHADRAAGRTESVLRLAQSAAPALALALRWGAWRQVLELGLATARQAGRRRQEAWFQHELGVHWICLDPGDETPAASQARERATAAVEAACALRQLAGDSRQLAASRRLLMLLQQNVREPEAAEAQTQVIRRPVIRVLAERSWPPNGLLRGWSQRNALLAVGGLLALSAVGTAVALGVSGSGGSSPAGGGTGVTGSVLNVGGTPSASASGSASGTASSSATAADSATASASDSTSATATGSAPAAASASATAVRGRGPATPTSSAQPSGDTSSAPDTPGQPTTAAAGPSTPGAPTSAPSTPNAPVQPSSQSPTRSAPPSSASPTTAAPSTPPPSTSPSSGTGSPTTAPASPVTGTPSTAPSTP
ncbi:hypothetical protein [Kitasatospora kifunensis]|uniref:Uncharacterized protein n=1 Tax=Kitasatospora kifunensis TaxID=58351 RepID=A0A7W7R1H2_KITKI|nr:hypothetical protein [Kitasatospora kifunensis]MBB4923525.1 hypothetical protein [Kitasatospora kifunensis]